jgi:hypothetical protein
MRGAIAAGCLLLLTAACGTETPDDPSGERRPAAQGSWASQTLPGIAGADSPTVLTTSGDDVLVVKVSDNGMLQSNLSVDGRPFEAGEPFATGRQYTDLAGAVRHEGGWFAIGSGGLSEVDGDEELLFEAMGLRSDDGLRWAEVAVDGFTGPADISALVESDGVLLAAGAYRDGEDPSMGGFRPMVWRSEDGATWTEVLLPGVAADGNSYVADLAVSDGRLLAVGSTDRHGMLWISDDAGASWQASAHAAVLGSYAVSRVAADGARVALSTMPRDEEPPAILGSADGGDTWTPAAGQPPAGDIEGYAPLWSGGGRFFTLTSRYVEGWREPEICYADINFCRQDSSVALYASDDAKTWSRVDTTGIGIGEAGEVDEATATEDGRVLAMQVRSETVEMHVWPGGTDLPGAAEPVEPSVELTKVPKDGVLEPGVHYHAPLYVHCGMDWLYLGEQAWRRSDDGPDVETGAGDEVDEAWPVAQQTIFGFAALTDEGVVEYTIGDGEVIATYAKVEEQPPGCD